MLTYEKEGIVTAILAVREFQRASLRIKLGSDWTEARMGMFFAGVEAHDDNLANPNELLTVADVSDYLTFGLKDSDTYHLPGEAGGLFIGVRSTGAISETVGPTSTYGWMADSSESCSAVGYAGATLINGGAFTNGSLRYPDPATTSGYNGFYCAKFVVSGRGTSGQAVHVSVGRSATVAGTDYGKAALYQAINNATFGEAKTIAWNNGVSARALPDAAWVRIPFYNARIRIQEIMAVKTSP